MLDRVDRAILRALQENGRTSNAEVARRLKMAPSAILERIRKLEKSGTIRGYSARLDPRQLGVGLLAFVFVRSDEPAGATRTAARLARAPEVQEVHHIAGEDCFLVKIRAADTGSLGRLLRRRFGSIPSIRSTRTTIVLETLKESPALPLPAGAGEDPEGGDA